MFMVIVICAITLAAGALMLWIANKSKSTSLSRSVSREIGADVETFLRNETFRMKVSRDACGRLEKCAGVDIYRIL